MTDPSLHEQFMRLHGESNEEAEEAASMLGHAAEASGDQVIAVSACLLGEKTRYDGRDAHVPDIVDPLLRRRHMRVIPLCPEILGGMGCPRDPVRFVVGDGEALLRGEPARIEDGLGRNWTAPIVLGAKRAERLADLARASLALLKERSPSCGSRSIHGPRGVVPGRGALAARFMHRNLPVASETDTSPLRFSPFCTKL
ncbi:MAG: DUF523 domain-containing protein [Deltaproteobacteria bacterium]|nr:DUF523 domain-containing protein [Deltaproteobacteria bacterium]